MTKFIVISLLLHLAVGAILYTRASTQTPELHLQAEYSFAGGDDFEEIFDQQDGREIDCVEVAPIIPAEIQDEPLPDEPGELQPEYQPKELPRPMYIPPTTLRVRPSRTEPRPAPAPTVIRIYPIGSNLPPQYPKESLDLRESGVVVLRIEVDGGGMVTSVAVATSSGYPRLDRAAIEAASIWRYTTGPGTIIQRIRFISP